MIEQRYDIGGMHCSACSSAVERVTRKLAGVERSEVNLPMNRLTIVYDETQTTPEMIIQKVSKAGFSAVLHTDEPQAVVTTADNTAKHETWGLIVSLVFAGTLLVISMGQMLFPSMPLPDIISMTTHPVNFALIQLLLTLPVLVIGKRFFIGGFGSLFHGNPNMDTLVALSATASLLYSIVMTFLISDNAHYAHSLYYESAAVVVALVSVGKYMEGRNKEKTKEAIQKLMALTPDTAILVDKDGQWEVPIEKIKVGDTVLVKPGAKIPLDGTVTSGDGSVNEAMLTGESLPVTKTAGSTVIGGSLSVDGALFVEVTHVGKDTALSKIIQFVENAQGKKAPISKLADQISGIFVPVVMVIATVSAIVWLLVGADFAFAVKIFTSVLVIACPCALGLATPTAIIVGTGLGANHGILIRNGDALETTHKVSVAIFDKTGTITEGKPTVTDVLGDDTTQLLTMAASLEILSDHPLSQAICNHVKAIDLSVHDVNCFQNHTGKGLSAMVGGQAVLVGSPQFIQDHAIDTSRWNGQISTLQGQGKTVVLVAQNGIAMGLIAIADTMRVDAAEAILKLKDMGIETVMLTGDNQAAANYIGTQAGVDHIVAQVLPTQKAEVVQQYQAQGKVVMMVGDGINDAPALTQADIGCAIGGGSDIAIDSAQIVLMGQSLTDVCRAIRLSRLTIRNIRQNLFWAFCYNTMGIPVAAGLFYASFGLLLSPMIGGLAMSCSSLFVVSNALRLKTKKLS
ncbi:heavy metal translocating P-type ATPase [Bengtsoniella intestinalis]|uniref:heavy metal translocating P-type ATPase n=1 Tax=Bengtsoniella intestinalis TaxID=3073143 RepID=UPI00391F0501